MDLNEVPEGRAEIKLEPCDYGAAECAMRLEGNTEHSRMNAILLEEKVKERCLVLELEIKKKLEELQLLQTKFKALEDEKNAREEHVKFWKNKNESHERRVSCVEGEGTGDVVTGLSLNGAKIEVEDESKVFRLMVENKILECERLSAQKEASIWMQKCMELESRLLMLEGSCGSAGTEGVTGRKVKFEPVLHWPGSETKGTEEAGGKGLADAAGANLWHLQTKLETKECDPIDDASRNETSTCLSPVEVAQANGSKVCHHARKRLSFENDRSPCKKMAPPTPGLQPTLIIDINDSDGDCDVPQGEWSTPEGQGKKMPSVSTSYMFPVVSDNEKEKKSNFMIYSDDDDEDLICHHRNHSVATPRRKRAANVVDSDSESDDNIPIGRFLRMSSKNPIKRPFHLDVDQPVSSSGDEDYKDRECPIHHRRRLIKMSQFKERDYPHQTGHVSRSQETEDVRDAESEEHSSASGDSINSFIVESTGTSDGIDASYGPEDSSGDSNVDFNEILSKLRRNNVKNFEWELEGDMLAAFGKDLELCLRAVCALYRQQTADEKLHKEALVYNKRGFSKFDAHRASYVAEFLTDGDPHGDLRKSVEELKQFDPDAPEWCMSVANTILSSYLKSTGAKKIHSGLNRSLDCRQSGNTLHRRALMR